MFKSFKQIAGISLAAAVLLAGCGGGGGGGGRKILLKGGAGDNGGVGGQVDVSAYTGGNLEILRHGSVDTSFELPKVLKPYLGLNPKTVTVSATWTTSDVLTGGENTITGDDGESQATGLWIKEGVTLTIYPNRDWVSCCDGLYDSVLLDFTDGVLIEGNIVIGGQDKTTGGDHGADNTANFYFNNAENIVIGPKATITTTPTAAGATAGWIDVDANSTVVNQGKITANGVDGPTGGNGGYIELYADSYAVYNTGDITNNGGTGSTGNGGDGGGIELYNDGGCNSCAGIFNRGKLTTNGGDGKTGGGNGGYIYFYADSSNNIGAIISSGDIEMSGGNCTGTNCDGGDSGSDLQFYNYSGEMRLSGKITALGGNGAGTGDGGDSIYDYIDIESYISGSDIDTAALGGNVFIGFDLNAVGGDGGAGDGSDGGWGSYFYVNVDHSDIARPLDYSVKFVGYDLIDYSGGDGRTNGGSVWSYDNAEDPWPYEYGFINGYTTDYNGDYWVGNLINEADITGKGGAGVAGDAGDSDYFELAGDYDTSGIQPKNTNIVKNTGKITLTGGDGKTYGGQGGEFQMYDQFSTENGAAVTTSGGNCTGSVDCTGGDSGEIDFYSDDVLINHADLIADGGAGTGANDGGSYNDIYLQGRSTTHSGKLSNNGGGAAHAGNGADGGYIEILSTNGASKVSGSANVAAGSNAAPDSNGSVYLDGLSLELDSTGNVNF